MIPSYRCHYSTDLSDSEWQILEPLRMAIATREVEAGLVHHSDRGVQYASTAYTELLKEHGIRISMSRRGNPYDGMRRRNAL